MKSHYCPKTDQSDLHIYTAMLFRGCGGFGTDVLPGVRECWCGGEVCVVVLEPSTVCPISFPFDFNFTSDDGSAG